MHLVLLLRGCLAALQVKPKYHDFFTAGKLARSIWAEACATDEKVGGCARVSRARASTDTQVPACRRCCAMLVRRTPSWACSRCAARGGAHVQRPACSACARQLHLYLACRRRCCCWQARNAMTSCTYLATVSVVLATAGITILFDENKTARIRELAVSGAGDGTGNACARLHACSFSNSCHACWRAAH